MYGAKNRCRESSRVTSPLCVLGVNFLKKRDQAKSTSLKLYFLKFFVVSQTNGILISFLTLEKLHWLTVG